MNQAVIVFSGYNPRAIVSFCRVATRQNVPFHILAASADDKIFSTSYASKVHLTRPTSELILSEVLGWLDEIRGEHGYDRLVLLPSTEFLNRFFLRHRHELEDAGHVVPIAPESLYCRVSDKKAFSEVCVEYNLAVPAEFDSPPKECPFVAKPLTYLSANTGLQLRPWLINSEDERRQFLDEMDVDDFFYQEMAVGKSLYLLFYVSKTGQDVLYSQENLIQQYNGGSILLATTSSLHQEPIAQKYLAMLKSVGFSGMIMIELKKTQSDFVMIEANPRLWGPIQFVVDCEIPIFDLFLTDCGFELKNPPKKNSANLSPGSNFYLWSGGMKRKNQPYIFHDYQPGSFCDDYPELMESDVYLRPDTINLYASEVKN